MTFPIGDRFAGAISQLRLPSTWRSLQHSGLVVTQRDWQTRATKIGDRNRLVINNQINTYPSRAVRRTEDRIFVVCLLVRILAVAGLTADRHGHPGEHENETPDAIHN
jgi:hypothetical protein